MLNNDLPDLHCFRDAACVRRWTGPPKITQVAASVCSIYRIGTGSSAEDISFPVLLIIFRWSRLVLAGLTCRSGDARLVTYAAVLSIRAELRR
jgi:hypothetical protein